MSKLNEVLFYIILSISTVFSNWEPLGPGSSDVIAIAGSHTDENIVYTITHTDGRISKTTDGGKTWSWKATIAETAESAKFFALAIDPLNNDKLYASSYSKGIHQSNDGGVTWKVIYKTGGGYLRELFVDPADSLTIYAVFGGSGTIFFVKTIDGGKTWVKKEIASGYYVWVDAFAVDPQNSNVIYIGSMVQSSGGYSSNVYKSIDGGKNFSKKYSKNGSIENILSLAVHPQNTNIIYMGRNSGIIMRSLNGGSSWSEVQSGLGSVAAVKVTAASPDVVYAVGKNKTARSLDAGAT